MQDLSGRHNRSSLTPHGHVTCHCWFQDSEISPRNVDTFRGKSGEFTPYLVNNLSLGTKGVYAQAISCKTRQRATIRLMSVSDALCDHLGLKGWERIG